MSRPNKRSRVNEYAPLLMSQRTRQQTKNHKSQFPFLELPPEIRLMIYPLCGLDLQSSLRGVIKNPRMTTPSILLVSRQVYYEARAVLKRFERLEFTIPQQETNFANIICVPALLRLKHLSIVIRHPGASEAEQFWPGYVAHSNNTVEQLIQWMYLLEKIWSKSGHNLRSFKMEFENDRVSKHLSDCHRGCYVRDYIRLVLQKFRPSRGVHHVELTGNVLEYFEKDLKEAQESMMRPRLPTLENLPSKILLQIAGSVVQRTDHVNLWKQFESLVWDQISRGYQSTTDILTVSLGKTPSSSSKLSTAESATSPPCMLSTGRNLETSPVSQLPVEIANTFRNAFRSLPRQHFSSPALYRVSRSMNALSHQVAGVQPLIFDQPFLPLLLSNTTKKKSRNHKGRSMCTISPFMTDQYLQAVRDVVLEYNSSFKRNWLWPFFVSALASLWRENHHLHRLTLRILDPLNEMTAKCRQAAVKALDPLASLRGVNSVLFEGPFKQSEKWKLEKMLGKSKKTN